jgi:hypothetical protein
MDIHCASIPFKMPLIRSFCFAWLFTFCALLPKQAEAQGWTFPETFPNWGNFALGFVGGIAGHEFGHYLIASSKGYRVHFDSLVLVYSGAELADADQLQVASAGFQAQWLMTELVLRDRNGKESKSAPGDFGAGVVCSHLGITFAYLTFLKNHKQGDITGMAEATGLSNNLLAATVAIPAALDAWRLFGNQVPGWVPHVSLLGKGLGMTWVWTY